MMKPKSRSLLTLILLVLLAWVVTRPPVQRPRHTASQHPVRPAPRRSSARRVQPDESPYSRALKQYVHGLIDEDTLIRVADEDLYETARAAFDRHLAAQPKRRITLPTRNNL